MHTCDSPHSPPRLLSHLAAVVLLLTLIASPASADMYKWVDAQGSLHFTDDLASVPARHQRDLASVATGTRDAGFNVVARQTSPTATRTSSMRHVVSLERAGLQMQVLALLNDSVETRFVVDTGAMMNSIPRSVVEELGIRIDARTPRVEVRGISAEPLIRAGRHAAQPAPWRRHAGAGRDGRTGLARDWPARNVLLQALPRPDGSGPPDAHARGDLLRAESGRQRPRLRICLGSCGWR